LVIARRFGSPANCTNGTSARREHRPIAIVSSAELGSVKMAPLELAKADAFERFKRFERFEIAENR
jgi:hypothetical protein